MYAFARAWQRPTLERWERGFRAITVPDNRWLRVDIKTIQLLPNALAMQAAVEADAQNAIFVRDGVVTALWEDPDAKYFREELDRRGFTEPGQPIVLQVQGIPDGQLVWGALAAKTGATVRYLSLIPGSRI